jgi:hypothetical protein
VLFVFCTRPRSEFRQINVKPSVACSQCRFAELSHSSNADRSRFEISPTSSSAITSTSAAQAAHHARLAFRPLKTNKDSVSIVIFVRFVISAAFQADLRYQNVSSLAKTRTASPSNRPENF